MHSLQASKKVTGPVSCNLQHYKSMQSPSCLCFYSVLLRTVNPQAFSLSVSVCKHKSRIYLRRLREAVCGVATPKMSQQLRVNHDAPVCVFTSRTGLLEVRWRRGCHVARVLRRQQRRTLIHTVGGHFLY